jgi:hypothetical protein
MFEWITRLPLAHLDVTRECTPCRCYVHGCERLPRIGVLQHIYGSTGAEARHGTCGWGRAYAFRARLCPLPPFRTVAPFTDSASRSVAAVPDSNHRRLQLGAPKHSMSAPEDESGHAYQAPFPTGTLTASTGSCVGAYPRSMKGTVAPRHACLRRIRPVGCAVWPAGFASAPWATLASRAPTGGRRSCRSGRRRRRRRRRVLEARRAGAPPGLARPR